ncbi:MAG: RNA-binding protein [Thermoplasmata archaeon]|nr:MAG: RNA-binding protein [Thermoplasmata archaeon]RLF61110.1 MAG: RNA-binding protein [Thermoplasmata archaeon]
MEEQPKIAIPSMVVGDAKRFRPGRGTFEKGGKIYSTRLGLINKQANFINIVPLSGVYDPIPGDTIIGIIEDISPTNWLVNINAPYPAVLHVNEVPWHVELGETSKYLKYADAILAKILLVDETKKIILTMKERGLHKLNGGQIIEIQPIKVPRVIGKKGTMISMIKKYTGCRIIVGQNGRIWIDGNTDGVEKATRAIRKIEAEAHTKGLTIRIEKLLKNRR